MEGIIKLNPFSFPRLKDLFIKSENNEDDPEEMEEPKKEESEDMPAWAKKLIETLKPEATKPPAEVPVPPAPQTEDEDEEDQQEAPVNPLKKLASFLW